MWSHAKEIADGDTVIVWMTREQLLPVIIKKGAEINGKFGYYRHDDLIGVPYGSKVSSRNGRGFIHILRPTPELWTRALPHRTQILYLADIAFVTAWLNIRPGSVVVEAGTGSGSFSHATSRTIGTEGRLYSYEFHEGRAAKAQEDFTRHGINNITLTHRNVCKDGFDIKDIADAVFLDLPAPWEAIAHAKSALRKDRVSRICCFSPCMEQVLRTVGALNAAGFTDVTMHESLLRPHDVVAIPPLPTIGESSAKLKIQEIRQEEKRQSQIAQSRARNAAKETAGKRKRDEEDITGLNDATNGEDMEGIEAKRVKIEGESEETAEMARPQARAAPNPPRRKNVPMGEDRLVVSRAFPEVKGHTSYLTFALLVPSPKAPADSTASPVGASVSVAGEDHERTESSPVV